MKLLIDENLSPRLIQRIEDLFFDSIHVGSVGLNATAMAERLIRGQAIRIAEFLDDPERAVLFLQPH